MFDSRQQESNRLYLSGVEESRACRKNMCLF